MTDAYSKSDLVIQVKVMKHLFIWFIVRLSSSSGSDQSAFNVRGNAAREHSGQG